MLAFFRPFLARIAAALIGALVAWLTAKGIDVPAETQAQLIEGTIAIMLGVFGIIYAVVHRLISKWTNPVDAAAPSLTTKVIATQGERGADPFAGPPGREYPPQAERGDETGG